MHEGMGDADGALSPGARRLVFGGLMLALTLPAFDLLILSTAGKDIVDDIGGEIIWMFIAYQITLVATMPLYGKLGDLYGRKRTFQAAIVLFVLASMIAGVATTPLTLVIGRALQGIAGGGIIGQAQAVLADIVPPRERGRVAWVSPTVWSVASMIGPFIGGFFVDHLTWRWVFFINGPAGLLAFVLIGVAFNVPSARVNHRLDLLGALLMVGAVALLSFAVSTGGESYAWTSPVIMLSLILGAVLSVLFFVQEQRALEPVFPFHLLRDRIVAVCTANAFCIGAANFGVAVFLPLFLRVVVGVSATEAGLSLLPMSLAITLASTVVGRRITRTGRYRWYPIVGTTLFAAGIYLLATLDQNSTRLDVWTFTAIAGFGSGIASPVLMLAMQNAVGHEDVGVVSSLAMFSRTIGQVFGPAIGGTLMAARFEQHVRRFVDRDTFETLDTKQLRTETKTIDDLAEPVRGQVVHAFRIAVNDAFRFAALVSALGIVIAAFMRTRPLRQTIIDREPAHSVSAIE
ncbi:MAG TPA: DHA2 family efflux MFS transporter permease subunit [Acidimicrobiales bacterium]|jgi:EmrB/QacA subfamily drug resistance transporter|nr:DHA2 family efflux MFS transporter permease subunit [Acidimicrobiales bacterium]